MPVVAPFLVACALLVVAGTSKALRPADTARAVHSFLPGMPVRRLSVGVGLLATGEVVLGVTALALAGPAPELAVAGSYVSFALVVAYARRRGGPLASCGCFGTPDTPASGLHVVMDLALAGTAVAMALAGPGVQWWRLLGHQPLDGAPLLGSAALGVWLVVLTLGPAARLAATRHEQPSARLAARPVRVGRR